MSSDGTTAETANKLRILIAPSGIDANGTCPGYPRFRPSISCTYPGWCLEIIAVLLRSGNISHEFVVDRPDEPLDWGTFQENGTFTGILGRVDSGEVDFACLFFQKSEVRATRFDFSLTVSDIRPTFIVREIPVTFWSLILKCLIPYETSVWIAILAALIVQMIIWTVIGRAEIGVGVRPPRIPGDYFSWDVFDEMFNGGDYPFYFVSGKLTRIIFAIFQKGLLPAMYTSFLLTALLTPVDNTPIKSPTDAVNLIQSGKYRLISDKSTWFAEEIPLSSENIFIALREATKSNPIIDVVSEEHTMSLVSQGGYIYQTQDDDASMITAAGKCYTFVFTRDMPFRSAHFIFRRGSPWKTIIDAQIMRNYIFIDQVRRRYFENRHVHQATCPRGMFDTPGAEDPLNFWSVSGIFVLASCGLIIAMISVIIEMIVAHLYNFTSAKSTR